MHDWINNYITRQKAALDSIPADGVANLAGIFRKAWREDRQILVFGNGGSAANASHFATDLGKGSSDRLDPASIPATLPSVAPLPTGNRVASPTLNGPRPGHAARRFRVMSLNDNVSWMTALGNDYDYDQIFVQQLINYGRKGDLVFALSVSGNSPNVVKALEWSVANGLDTIALVGGKRGRMAEIARQVIVTES